LRHQRLGGVCAYRARWLAVLEKFPFIVIGMTIDLSADRNKARASVPRGDLLNGDAYFRFIDDEIAKRRSR
jgi:hypothetical protein